MTLDEKIETAHAETREKTREKDILGIMEFFNVTCEVASQVLASGKPAGPASSTDAASGINSERKHMTLDEQVELAYKRGYALGYGRDFAEKYAESYREGYEQGRKEEHAQCISALMQNIGVTRAEAICIFRGEQIPLSEEIVAKLNSFRSSVSP